MLQSVGVQRFRDDQIDLLDGSGRLRRLRSPDRRGDGDGLWQSRAQAAAARLDGGFTIPAIWRDAAASALTLRRPCINI